MNILTEEQTQRNTPRPVPPLARTGTNGHTKPSSKSKRNADERYLASLALANPATFQKIAGPHLSVDGQFLPGDCSNPAYEWICLSVKSAGCGYLHQLTKWASDDDELAPKERRVWSAEALKVIDALRLEAPDLDPQDAKKELCGLIAQVKQKAAERRKKAKDQTPKAKDQTSNSQFPLTETGNGQRFARQNITDLRYCSVTGYWFSHKDGRWQPDENGEAERRAKQTALDVAAEAAREVQDDHRSRLLKHADRLTKRVTRETMLKDAASEPGMTITPEQFDTNLHLFNLANCTLNLQTFEAYAHRPDDLLTLQSPVHFDKHAKCPTWRMCMERWIPDEATRDYLQDTCGVSLSGQIFEEFFNFLYGGGDNGKSTFLRVLEQICGTYWHKTQAETIMQARDKRQPNAPSPELLALKGARLVTAHEIDSTHTLNAALIKDLTGRDSITARGCFEKRPTTFDPQFTLWMFGNGKPRITDTSGGMWRRPRLINFGQPIPLNERDPQLSEKLRMELPGILNWALDGLRRVYERGLIVPEAVKAATDDYKEEEDRLAGFLKDCCVTGPNYTSTARDLWAAWSGWCSQNGEREGSQRAFGTELKSHNFTPSKSGSTRGWKGIGLLVQPTEAAENGTQGTD